jgi:RHS repeat-associated protein
LGRRATKTTNGQTQAYQYDGADIIRDANAEYVQGPGIDNVLDRKDTATGNNEYYLKDHLGSTIALTDQSGNITTQYAYSPFGQVAKIGANSNNYFEYTGRENDGAGLYFYRARYYSPDQKRFIAEDPLGFGGGGTNLYSYVGNNPVIFTDPSGKIFGLDDGLELTLGGVAGAGGTAISELANPCGARGLNLVGKSIIGGAVGAGTTWVVGNGGAVALPATLVIGGIGNLASSSIGRRYNEVASLPDFQQGASEFVTGAIANLLGAKLSTITANPIKPYELGSEVLNPDIKLHIKLYKRIREQIIAPMNNRTPTT